MTDIKDMPERKTGNIRPSCPNCATPLRLRQTMLDPRRGRTVRLFECGSCGERLWDD